MTGYSVLNKRVKQLSANGETVIDRDILIKALDLSDVSREELEDTAKKALATIALNDNGFRSFIRGRGFYVDVEKIKNPKAAMRLLDYLQGDEESKKNMRDYLLTIFQSGCINFSFEYEHQLCFAEDENGNFFDENGNPNIHETISREELEEAIRKYIEAQEKEG